MSLINITKAVNNLLFYTSSKTRFMNLKESISVRMISATGTPNFASGSIYHRNAAASCSGVVVVRQRLEL